MSIGSFPLTRGTRSTDLHFLRSERFIPAYAGNSVKILATSSGETVHPRLRGELYRRGALLTLNGGSSPLTRGTHKGLLWWPVTCRFIPAYAGNSYWFVCFTRLFTVHPRLRGELLTAGVDVQHDRRFIPAYAGNSSLDVSTKAYNTVHPRLRGELLFYDLLPPYYSGSSPLTRGTQKAPHASEGSDRFIPAYAGNSSFLARTEA